VDRILEPAAIGDVADAHTAAGFGGQQGVRPQQSVFAQRTGDGFAAPREDTVEMGARTAQMAGYQPRAQREEPR
jgi:hypothetical protein